MRIELTTAIAGVTFAECYTRRVVVPLEDIPVPVIGLAALKRNQQAAGWAKDLADLENLP